MEYNRVICWPCEEGEQFDKYVVYALAGTPGAPGLNGWCVHDTSAGGTPVVANQNGGGVKMTLAATSEAEQVVLYQGDLLPFKLKELQRMEFKMKMPVALDSVGLIVAGLASAYNATEDSVATNAWFRIEGSASVSALLVETDDGTNDNDDKSAGVSLATTLKKFVIDFTDGYDNVKFYVDDQRVAASTTFDMTGAKDNYVQPYFVLQKGSGTSVPELFVTDLKVVHSKSYA